MSDICKCSNKECPKRFTCFRFISDANEHRQSYAEFKFDENKECDMYIHYIEI